MHIPRREKNVMMKDKNYKIHNPDIQSIGHPHVLEIVVEAVRENK